MKLLFVHDFPVEHEVNTTNYYSTGFPYSLWKRYLNVFDEINVISRYKSIKDTQGKTLSSGNDVNFYPIKEFKKGFKNIPGLIKNRKVILSKIVKAIKESDAVIVRVPSILGFLTALLCKKLNVPYMVEVVGDPLNAYKYHGSLSGKILAFPMDMLQKFVLRNAIVATYVTRNYLQSKYPTNGKDFNGLTDVVKVSNRNTHKISHDYFKLGLIGSTFTKYKGHEIAMKAMKILVDKGYNIQIDLVGQGMSKDLQKLINQLELNKNVNYLGVIYDREFLNNWFVNLDCYIQPSKTEGLCRSLVESVCLDVCALASNVGGNSEIISKEFLFEKNDFENLANLIESIIIDPSMEDKNIKLNKQLINKFDLNNIEQKRYDSLNYYRKVMEG